MNGSGQFRNFSIETVSRREFSRIASTVHTLHNLPASQPVWITCKRVQSPHALFRLLVSGVGPNFTLMGYIVPIMIPYHIDNIVYIFELKFISGLYVRVM